MKAVVLVLVLAFAPLAGCLQPAPPVTLPAAASPRLGNLTFAPPVTVDAARIASEPSVKVARDGTIFVVAPTGLIKYATRPLDAATMADQGIFQGAIWRSKDGGKTFEFRAGLGPTSYHSALPGGSDSDIAIDGKGTIVVADQLGLAAESVSYSTDKGDSWQAGSPTGDVDTDRQWLWPDPDHAGTFYLDYSGQNGVQVAKTTDNGQSWTTTTASLVGGDPGPIVALPGGFVAFTINDGSALQFVHSSDAGKTWRQDAIVKDRKWTDSFPQTVADSAGTLYVAWTEKHDEGSHVAYVSSTDQGKTWSQPKVLFDHPGLSLFLWVAAGAPGRLGFSWYEAPDPAKEWYEMAAVVTGADGNSTLLKTSAKVSDKPARVGEPCQQGVACTSGRELGDFQQCAITPDGDLVVSYVTVISADQGGRVTFARLAEGPKLVEAPPESWVV